MSERKTFSIRISARHKELLSLICVKENRKTGNMLEILIDKEAERLKIKLPKDWKPPVEQE